MVLNIQVLTPQRTVCRTTADEVILPGLLGKIGVLNGHATLVTMLDTGLLRIKLDQKWTIILLYGGVVEIDKDVVTVLGNEMEELFSVDSIKATNEAQEATSSVQSAENSKDRVETSIELKKANAKIEAMSYLT